MLLRLTSDFPSLLLRTWLRKLHCAPPEHKSFNISHIRMFFISLEWFVLLYFDMFEVYFHFCISSQQIFEGGGGGGRGRARHNFRIWVLGVTTRLSCHLLSPTSHTVLSFAVCCRSSHTLPSLPLGAIDNVQRTSAKPSAFGGW